MSSVLLIFCCLLGLGSAWNQPSTCYVRSSSGTEAALTKISESLEYLSELEHIREALETIADRLLDAACVSTTSMPTAGTSTIEATTAATSVPTAATSTIEATTAATSVPTAATSTIEATTAATSVPTAATSTIEATTAATSVPTAATSTIEATTAATSEPTAMTTDPPTASDTCGGPGWTRVAYINMTDPNQQCPQGLQLTDYSIRSCGRTQNGNSVCSSVMFPVSVQYEQVCGRAIGYRFGYNNAFYGYHTGGRNTIDVAYVDGLSVTHGQSPRTHIWTFASGLFNGTSSSDTNSNLRCPCDEGNTYGSPPFVGNDYFCDSVATINNHNVNPVRFYPDNALWDGQLSLNTCYNNNNPPWFMKTLSTPTTDDIELRMCFHHLNIYSNIGLQLMEIYIS